MTKVEVQCGERTAEADIDFADTGRAAGGIDMGASYPVQKKRENYTQAGVLL